VFAVPRSTAISFAGSQDVKFNDGSFIEKPAAAWLTS
jgi:hypothetical protein